MIAGEEVIKRKLMIQNLGITGDDRSHIIEDMWFKRLVDCILLLSVIYLHVIWITITSTPDLVPKTHWLLR